jgi:hypothetical protein
MGRLGVLLNPWGLARGNHQLLEVPNLANMLGEFRTGHFDWASPFAIVSMLRRRLCVKKTAQEALFVSVGYQLLIEHAWLNCLFLDYGKKLTQGLTVFVRPNLCLYNSFGFFAPRIAIILFSCFSNLSINASQITSPEAPFLSVR